MGDNYDKDSTETCDYKVVPFGTDAAFAAEELGGVVIDDRNGGESVAIPEDQSPTGYHEWEPTEEEANQARLAFDGETSGGGEQ